MTTRSVTKEELHRGMRVGEAQLHRLPSPLSEDQEIESAAERLRKLDLYVREQIAQIGLDCDMPFLDGCIYLYPRQPSCT